MSIFKNIDSEEKEIRKLKRKRISLKNLFVVQIGYKKEYTAYYSFSRYEYAVCKFYKKEYHSYFRDVFTGNKYYLFNDYDVKIGQLCCNRPEPFVSLLQYSSKKSKILSDGYINGYDLYTILEYLNAPDQSYAQSNNNHDYKQESKVNTNNNSSNNTKQELTEGKRLNDKVYPHEPAIGREIELRSIITTLASEKKSPILVGESGVGKTTIVDQLVYKIQRNEVPGFLKNKEVIELDTSSIVAGTKYLGTLEEKFKKIINYAINNDALLFIDEIHTIYGAGATSKDDNDIAEMLKKAIDRENIRVIGTTTSLEYEKYFSNDALKRRFEPTIVKEPNKETLFKIINQVFHNYSEDSNIVLDEIEDRLDKIIDILINNTKLTCRVYNDPINNPDLIIGIVDKSFADARINDQVSLTLDNIIYGVQNCSRIYDTTRERAIYELKKLKGKVKSISQPTSTIIEFKK